MLLFFLFINSRRFWSTVNLRYRLPPPRCQLCVPLFPQWHSDCCVLPYSFLFSSLSISFLHHLLLMLLLLPLLPYLPGSVSFTATELSRQHQQWNLWRFPQKENKREDRRRASVPAHLRSPALLQVFLFSFFRFSLLFFFIFDELVIAQGGRTACVTGRGRRGAGAVLQPSGMCNLVWEWWATPHPLLLVLSLHLCLQTLLSTYTCCSTFAQPHLSALWSHSWSRCGGRRFEWCVYRHGAKGRST